MICHSLHERTIFGLLLQSCESPQEVTASFHVNMTKYSKMIWHQRGGGGEGSSRIRFFRVSKGLLREQLGVVLDEDVTLQSSPQILLAMLYSSTLKSRINECGSRLPLDKTPEHAQLRQ